MAAYRRSDRRRDDRGGPGLSINASFKFPPSRRIECRVMACDRFHETTHRPVGVDQPFLRIGCIYRNAFSPLRLKSAVFTVACCVPVKSPNDKDKF